MSHTTQTRHTARVAAKEIKLRAMLATTAAALALIGVLSVTPARAQDPAASDRYAAIVVDAQSGEVFYAMRADSPRYPASLTKIMTLYMAFEEMAQGRLKPDDVITLSAHAASMPPTKSGLKAGDTITVDMAMRLIAAYSANDLAAALGEHIGGSEQRFAALMTVKAQELGMTRSNFVNASGLPDSRQVSSARDFAVLARAVMRDFPQYYEYFHVRSVQFNGRTYSNHNPLLAYPGVDGMKTGFINAAGYNLVASQRKGNHRLIAVMLGGSDKAQRREHVTTLMNTGFDVFARRDKGEQIVVAQNEFRSAIAPKYQVVGDSTALMAALDAQDDEDGTTVQRLSGTAKAPAVVAALSKAEKAAEDKAAAKKTSSTAAAKKKKKDPDAIWAVQVGAFKQKSLAADWAKEIKKRFPTLKGFETDVSENDAGRYRTRFIDMTKAEAQKACKAIEAKRLDCMVVKS
ncbi:D-alanyl-D-alanine carboxypeptidase [Asticcacaulis sp. DXS10W]|uniref:D-alanyl-D-alanine carboxypeptidase n=1 Tax=Asticcacaulis currens TaxID=2984210 RepID=A0ABT5IKW4_9CAUL|nr:D-alanyl-D-alanine carboxypeptidase [Asticcacaulis currens]MDC7695921.1 D-alanyl-D-alanine carboxypeptidase [Asticcacaulis currens]